MNAARHADALDYTSEKPDWLDAPDWANWLCQNADGTWYWSKHQMIIDEDTQKWVATDVSNKTGRGAHINRFALAVYPDNLPHPDWQKSSEARWTLKPTV